MNKEQLQAQREEIRKALDTLEENQDPDYDDIAKICDELIAINLALAEYDLDAEGYIV